MSRRRRIPTADERELFVSVVEGRPMKESSPPSPLAQKPPRARGASPHKPTGVDGRTAERLRSGEIEPDARIDLHGFTEAAAHEAVVYFVRGAVARGARLALVITGKGLHSAPSGLGSHLKHHAGDHGILRAMVPRWLHEPELARWVADIRPAHRRHGGVGALYVYLRKNRKLP